VRRNDHLLPQDVGEGRRDGVVIRGSPLEVDRVPDPAPPDDPVQVIDDHRVGKTRHEVHPGGPSGEVGVQILLHEDGAPLSHADGRAGGEGHFRELPLDLDIEPLRLLLQKGSRPRSASVVHREVHYHAVLQADELRILPADLEYRVHRLPEVSPADEGGPGLVGGDFILDGIRTYEFPDKFPARAGRADSPDPDSFPEFLPKFAQALRHHLHRPSLRTNVDLLQEVPLPVEEGEIRAHGPHVDPEEDLRQAIERGRLRHPVPQEDYLAGVEGRPGWERPLAYSGGICGEAKLLPLSLLLRRRIVRGQQRGADRSEMSISPRENHVIRGEPERIAYGAHHPLVGKKSPDKRHPGDRVFPLVDAALEVAGNRLAKPLQDLLGGKSFLLCVDHVALGEHRATTGDPGCASRPSDHLPDLLHVQPHPVGLLIYERTRAGGAVPAGVIVPDVQRGSRARLLETNDLRVLSPHLEDRPDFAVHRGHTPHQAAKVVFVPGSQGLGHSASPLAGDCHAADPFGADRADPLL
jgi:hypothetical protein